MRCGLLPRRFSLSVISAVLLVFGLAFAYAKVLPKPTSEPDVVRLMPKNNDIKGWEIYPETLVYAQGKELTAIYDGGYELYTKNGVVDAAQQIYRTKSPEVIASVTIHRMSSAQSAKRFYEYWQKTDSKQRTYKLLKSPHIGYIYSANDAANGYLYRDVYFITISIGSDKCLSDVRMFMEWIDGAVSKIIPPKGDSAGDQGEQKQIRASGTGG